MIIGRTSTFLSARPPCRSREYQRNRSVWSRECCGPARRTGIAAAKHVMCYYGEPFGSSEFHDLLFWSFIAPYLGSPFWSVGYRCPRLCAITGTDTMHQRWIASVLCFHWQV